MNKHNIIWKWYKSVQSVEYTYTFIAVYSWRKTFETLTASCFYHVTFVPVTRGLINNEPLIYCVKNKKAN
jgi:hypothetical protein